MLCRLQVVGSTGPNTPFRPGHLQLKVWAPPRLVDEAFSGPFRFSHPLHPLPRVLRSPNQVRRESYARPHLFLLQHRRVEGEYDGPV